MRRAKFDVKLPTKDLESITQNASFDYSRAEEELKAVFRVFDGDGSDEVLSGENVKDALSYFAQMESKISRCNKRNDKTISYLDFDEIAKDDKFKEVSEEIDKNSKNYTSGESIAYVANYLAELTRPNAKIDIVDTSLYFSSDMYGRCSNHFLYPEVYHHTKIINGERVTAITKGPDVYKAKNGRGHYVANPSIVAGVHGLKENKSLSYVLGKIFKANKPTYMSQELDSKKSNKFEWDDVQRALVRV